jgi:4-carboxymuconolactone decarboxylase
MSEGTREPRLAPLPPEDMTTEQRELYESIVASRSAGSSGLVSADGSLRGPFGPMLLAPRLGSALSDVGAAVRFGSSLEGRVRELAILAVAAHHRCAFEWVAHERIARGLGMTPTELTAIAGRDASEWTDPAERAAHRLVLTLLDRDTVDDELFDGVSESLGMTGVAELVILVGYYASLALLMGTYEVGLPEDAASSPPWPTG